MLGLWRVYRGCQGEWCEGGCPPIGLTYVGLQLPHSDRGSEETGLGWGVMMGSGLWSASNAWEFRTWIIDTVWD